MRLTVFTPSYNRAYTLARLFESLKGQSFLDFEWILIDDGSEDNTAELAEGFRADPDRRFDFTFIRTENGGKHRAINRAVKIARGELFFIVDSDDYLTPNALQRIDEVEKTIPAEEKDKFAGVCGLKGYSETEITGTTFEGEILDITMLERAKYNILGDKSEVFYTDVLCKYPFPEFKNENFLTECVVWDRIAFDGYKLRFFNDIVYICDYLEDGLSKNLRANKQKCPRGVGLSIYQNYKFGKVNKKDTKRRYMDFYYELHPRYSVFEISKMLCQSPVTFPFWIGWHRLINKIKLLKEHNDDT